VSGQPDFDPARDDRYGHALRQGPPHSKEAEASVVGVLLGHRDRMGEVVGTMLEGRHFYMAPYRLLFDAMVELYFADETWDPITLAEANMRRLRAFWNVDESEVVSRVRGLQTPDGRHLHEHARIVKSHSDLRELLDLSTDLTLMVQDEEKGPDEIAAIVSQRAMEVATNQMLNHETISYGDLGRAFYRRMKTLMAAREAGVEIGAYFGVAAMDDYMRGLKPTELVISAGEPGMGKSATWWAAAKRYAERQMQKPADQRIGVYVLSAEMGQDPSEDRLATNLTEIDGGKLREGTLSMAELEEIRSEWSAVKDLPLFFNFSSTLRASQMRALIVEQIRRNKIGVVIIDHYRHFELDERPRSSVEEDEEKAKFLKNALAKDLNIAVICIAHTTKTIDTPDRRPRLSNLRGSGQIAAFADFVNFVYRPYLFASEEERNEGKVHMHDAELIYEKNRHGMYGPAPFRLNLSTMNVY
jgi:replicative DNA helicase